MKSSIERVFENRWIQGVAAVVVGYVSIRVFADVVEGGYYDYYLYPRVKGDEYNFPELRYTAGQLAILVWSVIGFCATCLLVRSFSTGKQHKWAVPSVMGFVFGFVLLVVGFLVGMSLRGIV